MTLEIKTTREVINNELGIILNSVDYDVNHILFNLNKNKEWVSVESLLPEINKIYSLAYGSKLKNEYYDIEEIIKKIKKELEK